MPTVSIEDAQSRLSELIHQLTLGDELIITENERPVARLVAELGIRRPPRLGTMRGSVTFMAPDFDAPLDDFQEYME
jgi:antitoxin (DNA-binding transcriptional repressor) of toxin-antitoxin stability system